MCDKGLQRFSETFDIQKVLFYYGGWKKIRERIVQNET